MRVALVPPGDTSYVYRALSVVGIRDLVPIHASVEAALASLATADPREDAYGSRGPSSNAQTPEDGAAAEICLMGLIKTLWASVQGDPLSCAESTGVRIAGRALEVNQATEMAARAEQDIAGEVVDQVIARTDVGRTEPSAAPLSRGTRVTTASGRVSPIESLRPPRARPR